MQFIQLQPQNSIDIPPSLEGSVNAYVDPSVSLVFKDSDGNVINISTASYAFTSSYALNAGGGAGFPYTGSAEITGSLTVTGSFYQGGINSIATFATTVAYSSESISYVNYGTTGLDQVWSTQTDDNYYEIALPFTFNFFGTDYSSVFFGANNYFTFGAGSTLYDPINSSQPPLPGYHIAATDTYTYELWTGSLDSGNTFQIYVVASDNYNSPNQNRAYTFKFTSESRDVEVHIEKMTVGVNYNPDSSGVVSGETGAPYLLDLSSVIIDGTDYAFKIIGQELSYYSYTNLINGNVSASSYIGDGSQLSGIVLRTTGSSIYSIDPVASGIPLTQNSILIGSGSGYLASNAENSNFLGYQAGQSANLVAYCNFFGYQAGYSVNNTVGSNFFGYQAGYQAANAFGSNFLGIGAGYQASSSIGSNFLGTSAGYQAVYAGSSNFLGTEAGREATNADMSNFLGQQAGKQATNANRSNFLGFFAGYQATDANNSNFFGYEAGYSASNAYSSNFFGSIAGYGAIMAAYSNFLGVSAGNQAINAYHSNFLGNSAGYEATDANYSNFFGISAGNQATNANYSNFLGYRAGYLSLIHISEPTRPY